LFLICHAKQLEHLKVGNKLPYPLARKHSDVAMRTYAEHLQAWEEMDRLGYDEVGFNEHHCSPYGLMNSPDLMASAAAQRTRRLRLLIYGNLLPLHEPLRLAEELAMLDCLSGGRPVFGFARHCARVPSPPRAAVGIARTLGRGLGNRHARLDRGSFLPHGVEPTQCDRPAQQFLSIRKAATDHA
jgi:hypothetical protein